MPQDRFISPSKGILSFDETFRDIIDYISMMPDVKHKLIIGTDSQYREDKGTCFVTAIIVHREGKGGRYYYRKYIEPNVARNLKQRLFFEASQSLGLASRLAEKLAENGYADLNVEIHLDVGEAGPSREILKEVVGMIIGSGFGAQIKPNSFGASSVADRYTK
ncbi:MAG: ribonuclease H-like YkuK family protein [Firmicutes bacterium]|nr:ribonuclease H-like YkuK family protein [Bacillota bacterium]